jgi:hypothetical protein
MADEPNNPEAEEELPEGQLLPDREMMSLIKTPASDMPVSPPTTIDPLPVEED